MSGRAAAWPGFRPGAGTGRDRGASVAAPASDRWVPGTRRPSGAPAWTEAPPANGPAPPWHRSQIPNPDSLKALTDPDREVPIRRADRRGPAWVRRTRPAPPVARMSERQPGRGGSGGAEIDRRSPPVGARPEPDPPNPASERSLRGTRNGGGSRPRAPPPPPARSRRGPDPGAHRRTPGPSPARVVPISSIPPPRPRRRTPGHGRSGRRPGGRSESRDPSTVRAVRGSPAKGPAGRRYSSTSPGSPTGEITMYRRGSSPSERVATPSMALTVSWTTFRSEAAIGSRARSCRLASTSSTI